MSARLGVLLVPLFAGCAAAQIPAPQPDKPATNLSDWTASCDDWDEWDKPGPPYRIHGNTYYVGTCGIASILVTGTDGHVLIDSGTDEGARTVLANIRALGFDPRDVKTILMSHEHFDHVGGMARLQAATGATIVASAPAAAVLRSGIPGADDPQANSGHPPFPPVTGNIVTLTEEAPLERSGRKLTPMFTPGHTLGATSWNWQDCDSSGCKWIVYADSMNPISSDDYRFSDHPQLVAAFRNAVAMLAELDCDILITPHPSASGMRDKLLAGDPTSGMNCREYAESVDTRLDERLAKEADGG